MRINNNYNSNNYKPCFANKVKSVELMETLIGKNIESENINGFKAIVSEFQPQYAKASGHEGYYKLAQKLAKQIIEQNSDNKFVKESLRIKDLIEKNSKITKSEIQEYARPIIKEQGEIIDIQIK